MTLPSIAFAGIGLMGLPMTRRLLAAGYPLSVWNRSADKCAPSKPCAHAVWTAPPRSVRRPISSCSAWPIRPWCARWSSARAASSKARGPGSCWWISPAWNRQPPARWRPSSSAVPACAGWTHRFPAARRGRGRHPGDHGGRSRGGCRARAPDTGPSRPAPDPHGRGRCRPGDQGVQPDDRRVQRLVIAEVVALAERSGVDASLLAPALAGGFADSRPLQILAPQMAESRFEPIKWHVRTLLRTWTPPSNCPARRAAPP